MNGLMRHRQVVVWAVLLSITLLSWALGEGGDTDSSGTRTMLSVGVLGLGFAKAHYVGMDFMELRDAPAALRLAFDAWVVGVFLLLTGVVLVTGL